jgi:1-pyrroline-5-carboxylate dehydrogenase
MTAALPRVTYSNIAADFTPLHDWLDDALPKFRADMLGRAWPNIVGNQHNVSGTSYEVRSPIDRDLLVARLVAADERRWARRWRRRAMRIPRGPGGRGRSAWR